MKLQNRPRRHLAFLLLAALLALSVAACEKDARALTQEAQIAMVQQEYDKAITTFEAALAKEPANVDATLGLAETYLRKDDLTKSREWFDKARKLQLAKAEEQYLNQKLQELLMAEARKLKDGDPDAYEQKLREVIAVKDRGQAADEAYGALGDLYLKRADALAQDKAQREKAVAYYEQMKTIRTQPALRKQALEKARILKREIFADLFDRELDKLSETLKTDGLLDEANKRIKVVALVEDKDLNPKTDEDKEAVRAQLSKSATLQMINLTYTLSATPVPAPDAIPNRFKYTTAKVEEEIIEKGKAQLTVSVTLDELEDLAYKAIILPLERDAEKKDAPAGDAPAGDAPEGDAPEGGTNNAGATPEGATNNAGDTNGDTNNAP